MISPWCIIGAIVAVSAGALLCRAIYRRIAPGRMCMGRHVDVSHVGVDGRTYFMCRECGSIIKEPE